MDQKEGVVVGQLLGYPMQTLHGKDSNLNLSQLIGAIIGQIIDTSRGSLGEANSEDTRGEVQ